MCNFPIRRLAELIKNHVDIYYMKFNYVGQFNDFICEDEKVREGFCEGEWRFQVWGKFISTISLFAHAAIESDKMVDHMDDLCFIFPTLTNKPIENGSSKDAEVVEKYTKLLADFAKNGYRPFAFHFMFWIVIDKTFDSRVANFNDEVDPAVAKYDNNERYVYVGDKFELREKPFKDYDLWDRLFPK